MFKLQFHGLGRAHFVVVYFFVLRMTHVNVYFVNQLFSQGVILCEMSGPNSMKREEFKQYVKTGSK